MTRSIFDPTGGEVQRGGNSFLPEEGRNRSNVPPDLTDGVVEKDEELAAGQSEKKEDVADRLDAMNSGEEPKVETTPEDERAEDDVEGAD